MSAITTHVLDLSRGRPAAGMAVRLERRAADRTWEPLGQAATDEDGRVRAWAGAPRPATGSYRLCFETGPYFSGAGVRSFYPEVNVVFEVTDPSEHHHVPLLLSPFGYSTYRGS
jgi:5-hydroxyisourate hydrolase